MNTETGLPALTDTWAAPIAVGTKYRIIVETVEKYIFYLETEGGDELEVLGSWDGEHVDDKVTDYDSREAALASVNIASLDPPIEVALAALASVKAK